MKTTNVHIKGISPLLMHNGLLADPLNEHVLALKKLTKLNKKTEENHRAIYDLEFLGSLYVDESGHPCIPGENVEAMIVAAAKKTRMGKQAQSSIFCDGNFPLIYKGPKTAATLVKDMSFRDSRTVVVQRARIIRTRPRFNIWEADLSITYEEFTEEEIRAFVELAGASIGLGDYRPKFGRFLVE